VLRVAANTATEKPAQKKGVGKKTTRMRLAGRKDSVTMDTSEHQKFGHKFAQKIFPLGEISLSRGWNNSSQLEKNILSRAKKDGLKKKWEGKTT